MKLDKPRWRARCGDVAMADLIVAYRWETFSLCRSAAMLSSQFEIAMAPPAVALQQRMGAAMKFFRRTDMEQARTTMATAVQNAA